MTQPGPPYEHYEVSPAGEEYTGQYNPQQPYSGQPYPGPPQQYSAPPYANQPYSAPPQQPPYQPPYAQPQPPAPRPPRRSGSLIVLLASLGVLAIVAVAVVIVVVVQKKDGPAGEPKGQGPAATSAASAPSATPAQVGPVDSCLIGNWRQTTYRSEIDLSSITLDGRKLGDVVVSGDGRTWKIGVDGKATEDFSKAVYRGRTDTGKAVEVSFTGKNEWDLKTADHQILFTSTGSTVAMTVKIDGANPVTDTVAPHNNPQPYECSKNSWTAKSLTDENASTVYTRAD
ncbi:hypothetical protein Dvina_40190 [Dactylosporangium vinaceum]|uniref:Uncharacterized protein n=1 Tax=Dactylosporangium vinaceum TaxID=53362 RepID=A0ABV5M842_9ACTN|nr:hypothetical protein [Dactylosporangium vinaceum]UAB94322.1 hypothetical protein Dvina_40190 [Dactylosporangium vinaceum]